MKEGIFHTTLVKRGGKLSYENGHAALFKKFEQELDEGQRVDVFFEALGDNYTLGQLAKVHKCIRTLAADTGESFEKMKMEVKKRAGIAFKVTENGENYLFVRSFADCSAAEIGLAIEAAVEIGDSLGINLR